MKKEDLFNKFSKILDLDNIFVDSLLNINFKNKNLEEEYRQYLVDSSKK